jgi:potassium-transporting ATPase potassium-binding subunit
MWQGFFQIALTLGLLVAIVPIFATYIADVFLGKKTILDPILNPLERTIYKLSGVRFQRDMTGWQYACAMLLINLVMGVFVYFIISLQGVLPLNPNQLNSPPWDLSLHTTISFLTNTNQQHYSGENTLSYASQVLALGFLMFTSAATGLAVSIAFIRGITGRSLGNFYVDFTRSITRILLPISLIGAIILLALGVPETLAGSQIVTPLDGGTQAIARGPIAHFEIIKQLGENGGGFFGANSAHPYENPNGFSNLIETLAMVCIPASLIYTFGIFTQDKKQAWLLFGMVFLIYSGFIIITAMLIIFSVNKLPI